jgi:hypothetical protein
LSKEQLAAKRELQALHEAIQNDPDITSANAKGNLSEFVAEALSNKELQDQLRNKKWTLKNAWDSFKKILMNMLGIKVPENMLDAALASADTLFARPEPYMEKAVETPGAFQKVAKYDPKLNEAGKLAERLIATKRPLTERMNANSFGRAALEAETKLVDQYAPLVAHSKKMDSLAGTQMMHYLRMVGQRMNLLGQTVGIGAPELRKVIRPDGRAEYLYEAKEGPSLVGVAKALQPANRLAGSPAAANNLFSLYSIAKRAESVGLDKLNYKDLTQAQVDKAMAEIKAVPGLEATFKNAHAEYEKFNRNMVQFGVDTGVFSKEMAAKMTKNGDYVPYYRENGDGSVSMLMGNERIANMGNVKDQPYLHELVGGDQRIADFMTSSVNNANMILEMGLRNQATKNVAFELEKIGLAKIGSGNVRSSTDVIKFKLDGKDKYAIVESTPDVPAELLVKGMEGIPVQTSALLRIAGMPSRLLREMFVANPISAGRILFKDTISSAMVAGSNFDGIRAAMKNVGNNLMERRGLSGGEVYTGLPQDLTNILRQVQTGKPGWETLLAKANVLHAKADAMTRQIRYESYLKQGLSEMEANHMALESMNFTRRGISPSIHILNTLNPFINSQIQGLNTLIRAVRGNMPMNEKLRIREKIIKRGMLLAGATMMYSSLMQDDETYKNALPEQKYNNFFVPFPGIDEKVRVPIPFEAGILFKSIPEALVNYMYGHDKDAAAGLRQAVMKMIPGGDTEGVPQILRPAIEVGLDKSFYTGRDLESKHEQALAPGMRTRDNTTGLAAALGESLNMSPIKLDHLISGYTGQLGLAVTQMASSLVFGPKMAGPEAAKHLSQMSLVGSTFQPKDAGAITEDAYQMMTEANQVKATVQDLLKKGKVAEAQMYLNKNAEEYAKASISTQFTSAMKQVTDAMTAVKASTTMTPEQKLAKLDELKAKRTELSEKVVKTMSSYKTTPQPALQ